MRGALAPNRPWGAMGTLMMALPLAEGVGSLRRLSEGLPMGWGALLGVVLLSGGSGGLQRWAHQPPYTEANPGEEVLMPCIVQNIQVGRPTTYEHHFVSIISSSHCHQYLHHFANMCSSIDSDTFYYLTFWWSKSTLSVHAYQIL